MPAANIQTLMQLEDAVEPVIVTAATQSGLIPSANCFAAHSNSVLVTPSLSVWLAVGATTGHMFAPPTLSYYVPDQWHVTVQGIVRTNRGSNAASHATYRAILRMVMFDVFARVNPGLTYHAFAGQAPSELGTQNSVDTENNQDVSQVSFGAVLAIKSDAWPVA